MNYSFQLACRTASLHSKEGIAKRCVLDLTINRHNIAGTMFALGLEKRSPGTSFIWTRISVLCSFRPFPAFKMKGTPSHRSLFTYLSPNNTKGILNHFSDPASQITPELTHAVLDEVRNADTATLTVTTNALTGEAEELYISTLHKLCGKAENKLGTTVAITMPLNENKSKHLDPEHTYPHINFHHAASTTSCFISQHKLMRILKCVRL